MSTQRPRLKVSPEHYAFGYELHLYCDHASDSHGWRDFPAAFIGETFTQCARRARKRGWKLHPRDRTATCPKCVKALAV